MDELPAGQRAIVDEERLRPWIATILEAGEHPEPASDGRRYLTMWTGKLVELSPELRREVKPGRRRNEWLVPIDL